MRKTPSLDTTRRMLRSSICMHCPARPVGCVDCTPDQPLPCENNCRLFRNLGLLCDVARKCDPMLQDPHVAVEQEIQAIKSSSLDQEGLGQIVDGLSGKNQNIANLLARLFD